MAALIGVLGLIWVAARIARLGGFARRPTAGGTMGVEDVLALDTRRRLHLIRCGQRRVLVLTGGPQDVVVGWLDGGAPSS
jgi:flagellar protein FliO/FliZ